MIEMYLLGIYEDLASFGLLFYLWIVVAIIALIIEFETVAFYSFSFTFGALVALVMSWYKVSPVYQIVAFLLSSFLFMLVATRILRKRFHLKKASTNLDLLIDQEAYLLSNVSRLSPGLVKIGDVIWDAVVEEDIEIEQGTVVKVIGFKGNKVVIKK